MFIKYDLSSDIVDGVDRSELQGLISDNSEAVIDGLSAEGTLKDLPVVGNFFKVYNICESLSNFYASKKILKFLLELQRVPEAKRKKFVNDMNNDPNLKKKVGDRLLLLLEKFEAVEKAELLARALILLINEEVTLHEFEVLAFSINQFNLAYYNTLAVAFKYDVENIENEAYDHFVSCGFLTTQGSYNDKLKSRIMYKTAAGKTFASKIINLQAVAIKSFFYDYILNLPISPTACHQVPNVTKLNSREEAKALLENLSNNHFEGSFISGNQFIDKNNETRFRRIGPEKYEFFYNTDTSTLSTNELQQRPN